jgi:hypothetical protein
MLVCAYSFALTQIATRGIPQPPKRPDRAVDADEFETRQVVDRKEVYVVCLCGNRNALGRIVVLGR